MSNQLANRRAQIVCEAAQERIVPPQFEQLGTAIDEKFDPLGQRIELAQQA